LSFGLVNVPVKVYPATEPRAVSFRELHDECKTPLVHKRWCPADNEEVAWEHVAKGFEVGKDSYVVLSMEDLEAARLKTTSTIDIVEFVDKNEIDPIYFEKPYYLTPRKGGEKAYWLLKDALASTNTAAVARFVIREKEYLCAVFSYKNCMLLTTLHFEYELRDTADIEELKKKEEYNKEEENLAIRLISSKSTKFDISKFKDRYAEAIKAIVKDKLAGKKIVMPKERIEKAKELMEALKASVASGRREKK
jgi:DNA end-binding protein Ku